MISPNIITEISKREEIGWAIVEKDYFLTLLLDAISHEPFLTANLVFKGGTALRKVYFKGYRYSEDLDFTLRGKLAGPAISAALESAFGYLKYEYNADFRIKDFNSKPHFTDVKLQFVGLKGNKNTITLDLTADEVIVDETKERPILNQFYAKKFAVQAYSLEEIAAEKLRSLIQRTRVRDYYDLWFLLNHNEIATNKLKKIFLQKLAHKKLSFTGKEQLLGKEKLEQAQAYYNSQLKNQLKQLPPFEKITKELEKGIDKLRL